MATKIINIEKAERSLVLNVIEHFKLKHSSELSIKALDLKNFYQFLQSQENR